MDKKRQGKIYELLKRGLNLILLVFIFIGLSNSLVFQKAIAAIDAVEVNISVTAGSGDDGGGDGGDPIPGCTDSEATNYNSSATEDDGSCQYPPVTIPNVSNFSATLEGPNISLTWQNPSFATFVAVRIVRRVGSLPTSPTDGDLIYDGAGESKVDTSVEPDTRYYYVAFVRDTTGDYSSGAVASITTLAEEEEEPPPPPDKKPSSDGDGVGDDNGPGGENDPFAQLPQATEVDPITQLLTLGDFIFSQPGERLQFFDSGKDIFVIGQKSLSVLVPTNKLPESLKIIGLTIIDPRTGKPFGSYLLKTSADGKNYTANIANALPNGIYPLFISIINYQDQSLKRLAGRLVVSNGLPTTPAGKAIARTVRVLSPVAVTVGLATGIAQGLALGSRVSSVYDFYLILLHGWALFLRVLGLRRRVTPWGVVYDSVTKRPLDPAYVIIRKKDDDKGTAITDLDGRYGFFLPADTYNIVANKTHYQFPSKKLAGRSADELYGNLYFGEPFTTQGGELINRNIPLDPIAFDWNEYAKQARGFFILHSRRQARRRRLFNILYVTGFLIGFYNLVFHPEILSIIIFTLYLVTFLARYIKHRTGARAVAVKRITGEPVPFAIIRAFMPEVNQEIKAVVADALGRFFLLTPPGRYYITVEEKLPDETYKKIFQSPALDLKNGVLTNDLVV